MALFAALTMTGPDLVVETAVVGLLVTLAVFLLFLGLITGAIFQQREP